MRTERDRYLRLFPASSYTDRVSTLRITIAVTMFRRCATPTRVRISIPCVLPSTSKSPALHALTRTVPSRRDA